MAIFGKFFYAFAMFIMLAKLTQASPRPDPYLLEGELTALLQSILEHLDPALVSHLTMVISEPFFDVQITSQNVSFLDFSNLEVIQFDPPMPFVSKELKLVVHLPTVRTFTAAYTMAGQAMGETVDGAGTSWMEFFDLVFDMTFKTDSFSSDSSLEVCVKYHTFSASLSVGEVTGEFEGLPVINNNMKVFGPMIVKQTETCINDNWELIENALNNIFCPSSRNADAYDLYARP